MNSENLTSKDNVLDISRYIGIPFKPGGRTLAGLDCWGLVRLILRNEFHVEVPSFNEDYHPPFQYDKLGDLARGEIKFWQENSVPKTGDVALFRIQRHPVHVGLVVRPGWMIHTERRIQSCLERYENLMWKKRLQGFFRHTALVSSEV